MMTPLHIAVSTSCLTAIIFYKILYDSINDLFESMLLWLFPFRYQNIDQFWSEIRFIVWSGASVGSGLSILKWLQHV